MLEKEGKLFLEGFSGKIAIIASRFNSFIVNELIQGAKTGFQKSGIMEEYLELIWVPGAIEIPLILKILAKQQQYKGFLILGAVIQGESAHFDYVASQSIQGVIQESLKNEKPISVSILTTYNQEQALSRAGLKDGNKGFEGALTLVEMISLINVIQV